MKLFYMPVRLVIVFVFSVNTYAYGLNSSVKIDDIEFCIRIDFDNPSVMKVLPMKTKISILNISSTQNLSRLEICRLGLLNTEDNKDLFSKYGYIANIGNIINQGVNIDLFIADYLSNLPDPFCVFETQYKTGIGYTPYYINTFKCTDDKNTEPVSAQVATIFDQQETSIIDNANMVEAAQLIGGVVILGGIYYLSKNPNIGTQLSNYTSRLSQYIPRIDSTKLSSIKESLMKDSFLVKFSQQKATGLIKWTFNTTATGVVLYVVGSYLFSYGNTAINKSVDPAIPYKEIHEISGYEIIPRNNHLYVIDMFVSQLNNGAFYLESESLYAPARSAFIQAARTSLLYNEPVFRNTISDIVKVIPNLNFEFIEKGVHLQYSIENTTNINLLIDKKDTNKFLIIDKMTNEKFWIK